MPNPYIEVNEFLPNPPASFTGHTNISFFDGNGNLLRTIGANIHDADWTMSNGFAGGIYDETDPSKVPAYTTRYYMDSATFSLTYDHAQYQIHDENITYFAAINNCVDFVHRTLNYAGIPHDLTTMFQGVALNAYADSLTFLVLDFAWLRDQLQYNAGEALFQQIDDALSRWDSVWTETLEWGEDGVFYVTAYGEEEAENEEEIYASPYSPIVVDLDGDGISTSRLTLSSNAGVRFDLDGSGTIDRVAWINGDDAFLTIDLNGDNVVNSGLEMFGGANQGDGFAELAALDDNNDGVIDSSDSAFGQLRLWRDGNGDGVTDFGELQSLSSSGLSSIALDYQYWGRRDHGNILGERSTASIGGSDHLVVDVYLRADLDFAA